MAYRVSRYRELCHGSAGCNHPSGVDPKPTFISFVNFRFERRTGSYRESSRIIYVYKIEYPKVLLGHIYLPDNLSLLSDTSAY